MEGIRGAITIGKEDIMGIYKSYQKTEDRGK